MSERPKKSPDPAARFQTPAPAQSTSVTDLASYQEIEKSRQPRCTYSEIQILTSKIRFPFLYFAKGRFFEMLKADGGGWFMEFPDTAWDLTCRDSPGEGAGFPGSVLAALGDELVQHSRPSQIEPGTSHCA